MFNNTKINLLLVLFLNLASIIKAEQWKFNVVSISEPEYEIGLKYQNKIIKMESTGFPVFTTTIEPTQIASKYIYKYVLLDKSGNVVDEEKNDRAYDAKTTPTTYEVYNRLRKDVKIPSLTKVYNTNYIKSSENYQPYDDSQIYTIYAKCNEDDYKNLKYNPFLNGLKNDGFANCTISFVSRTEVFERTGSLQLIGFDSRKYKKLSWKIKLDKKIFGRKNLKLRSNANDATMMRDKINTELYKALGVPTYSSAYARLTINDDVYGLYSLIDSISGNWISSAIHGDDKARIGFSYKTYSGADLKYLGEKSSSYLDTGAYELDEVDKEDTEAGNNDWYRLIKFTKLFSDWNNQYSNQSNKVAFNALNRFFNIESLLRQMVIESLTYSYDNFWANSGNFALYYNPEEQRYQIIPYDYDGSFYGSNGSPRFLNNYLKEPTDCINWAKKARYYEDYYFIDALFAHNYIKNRYNKIMSDTIEKVFNVNEISKLTEAINQLIEDDVEWNFSLIDNLDKDIPGFTNHFTFKNFKDNVNYNEVGYNPQVNHNDACFGIKQWIKERGEQCQRYVNSVDLEDEVAAEPEVVATKKTATTFKKITKTTTTTTKITTTVPPKKTTTTSKGVPKSTHPFKCGPNWGSCYVDGECCSKKGYCGTTEAYCGKGCQSEFGVCDVKVAPKKTTTTTTTTTIVAKKKFTSKITSSEKKTSTTSKKVPLSTVYGRCGPKYGACPNSRCCSKYNYCGASIDYCGAGCQVGYGLCN